MNENPPKELIIALIREDLVHQRLLSGLNNLGLHADDYSLNLSELIFSLLGYEAGTVPDRLYERYLQLREEQLQSVILNRTFRSQALKLAEDIYEVMKI
jgi:hypothetical protein